MIEPLIRAGERRERRQRVRLGGRLPRSPSDERRGHRAHPEGRPGATVIVHGEVRPELQRAADAVLSTSQMAKYVDSHPEQTRYAILTECGLVVRLELDHPEKQFYKPCRLCRYMKATDLESVYRTLRDEPPAQRITVPEDVRAGAARAMLKMIELASVTVRVSPATDAERSGPSRWSSRGWSSRRGTGGRCPGRESSSQAWRVSSQSKCQARSRKAAHSCRGRRLRRQHQPLLLEKGDGQRPLRQRDLRQIGIDRLERAVDAREGVVEEMPVAFFVHAQSTLLGGLPPGEGHPEIESRAAHQHRHRLAELEVPSACATSGATRTPPSRCAARCRRSAARPGRRRCGRSPA